MTESHSGPQVTAVHGRGGRPKVGWLAQQHWPVIGGAELSAAARASAAPEGLEIIPCSPGAIDPDCDAYVANQCRSYGADAISALEGKPVVTVVPDWWEGGDADLRRWLLENSRLVVFSSPLHRDWLAWPVKAPTFICPPPLNLKPFFEARDRAGKREGAVWLGQMTSPWKGYQEAISWAEARGVILDFFGEGEFKPTPGPFVRVFGEVPYDQVPALLARYRWFVFLPTRPQPFARVLAEAWAAGCQLETVPHNGFRWWLENAPRDLDRGAQRFWRAFCDSGLPANSPTSTSTRTELPSASTSSSRTRTPNASAPSSFSS